MSTTYGNVNYRKKFDAFKVIDDLHISPLKEAVRCAQELHKATEAIEKALDLSDVEPETLAQLTLALARAKPAEFNAWIDIAEFVYAKPKQTIELESNLTLEQILAMSRGNPTVVPTIGPHD